MNTLRVEIENERDISVLQKLLTDMGFKFHLESEQNAFENITEAAGLGIATGLRDAQEGRIISDKAARTRIEAKISEMKNKLAGR